MATTTKTGYCNGGDMLLYVNGKPFGHCTSHTTTVNTETKERSVKPVASAGMAISLWKNKGIVGLSVSISAEGLVNYQEQETGYKAIITQLFTGQSVQVKCMERDVDGNSDSSTPYLSGNFVITKLERTDPAQDDSTYSIELENDGAVTLDATKLT